MASSNRAGHDDYLDAHKDEKTPQVELEAIESNKPSCKSVGKSPFQSWKLGHVQKSLVKPKCDCDAKKNANDLNETNVRTQAINFICCISQQTVYSESLLRTSQLTLSSPNSTLMYETYAKTRPRRVRSVSESTATNNNKHNQNEIKIRPLVRSVSAGIPTATVQTPPQKKTKTRPPLIRSISENPAPRSREANIRAFKTRPARIRSVSECLPRSQSSESHKKFQHEQVDNALRKVCSLETIPEDRALILEPHSELTSKAILRASKLLTKKGSKRPTETPPPEADKGWAWMVLLGCLYNTIMVLSFGAAFGIQFGKLLADLGLSATTTAWIFNVQGFLFNLTPAVVGPLCRQLGWREVAFTGALVSAAGFISLAFVNSPTMMFFLYSVVLGLAGGTLHNVTALILPRYFFKHRGLALGLNSTAVGVSQIIMPHIITNLLKEYGYLGSMLIRGGFLLNCCVAVSLFRPLKVHRRKPEAKSLPKTPSNEEKEKSECKNGITESVSDSDPANIELLPSKKDDFVSKTTLTRTKKVLFSDIITEITTNLSRAFSSLKSYRVLINVVMFPNFLIGYINFGMIVPFYMASFGHSAIEAAWALTLSAVSSSLARLFTALLSDRSWFSRSKAFIVGSIIAAISSYCFINVQSDLMKVYCAMVMWGFGVGTAISLRYVLLIDTVGMDVYVPALGACGFAIALTFAVVGPIFGIIRDASSSYSGSLGACAVLQLSAALLWLLMPCAQDADLRREKRREKEQCRQNL